MGFQHRAELFRTFCSAELFTKQGALTAEYKVLQPRLLLHTCFFNFMVIYRTSVKIRDQQMGQNLRLVLFSFIYFFLLSFFLSYQESDSSGEASEVYLKASLSNLAPDSAIMTVVPHLLQVHTDTVSSSTPPELPVSPSQVHLMRSVSHIVR